MRTRTARRAAALISVALLCMTLVGCDATDSSGSSGGDKSSSSKKSSPKSPADKLQAAVDDSDADHAKATQEGRNVTVEFDVKDNFGAGAIQGSLALDVFDMAERLVKSGVPFARVAFTGMFPLVDKYGKKKDGPVFRAQFTYAVLKKINYDNIDVTSMDVLQDLAAGPVYLHPDFQD